MRPTRYQEDASASDDRHHQARLAMAVHRQQGSKLADGLALEPEEHVAIRMEGDADLTLTEELLHHFGVRSHA